MDQIFQLKPCILHIKQVSGSISKKREEASQGSPDTRNDTVVRSLASVSLFIIHSSPPVLELMKLFSTNDAGVIGYSHAE